MAEVENLCDRIAILSGGRIAFIGTVEQLGKTVGKHYNITIQTETGTGKYESDNIGETLLTLLVQCREKGDTLIQSMTVFGVTMGALIGLPPSLVEIYGSDIKKVYLANGVPLYPGIALANISAFIHLFIMSISCILPRRLPLMPRYRKIRAYTLSPFPFLLRYHSA
jgi:hypothetical protein